MDRRGPLGLRPTRDHAIPRSRGFSLIANKIICCHDCNQKKRDRTLLEWLAALRRSSDPLDRVRVRRLNILVEEWQRRGLVVDVDEEEVVVTIY